MTGFHRAAQCLFLKGPAYRCLDCGTRIQSRWVHDMQACKCGRVSVDGGHRYTKLSQSCDAKGMELCR